MRAGGGVPWRSFPQRFRRGLSTHPAAHRPFRLLERTRGSVWGPVNIISSLDVSQLCSSHQGGRETLTKCARASMRRCHKDRGMKKGNRTCEKGWFFLRGCGPRPEDRELDSELSFSRRCCLCQGGHRGSTRRRGMVLVCSRPCLSLPPCPPLPPRCPPHPCSQVHERGEAAGSGEQCGLLIALRANGYILRRLRCCPLRRIGLKLLRLRACSDLMAERAAI